MTKLKALRDLSRKQLRALIAILVAVCVVVPSCVFGIANLRGKAEDAGTYTLVFDSNNEMVVGEGGIKKGTSYRYNSDSYTFDANLYQGDVLTYHPEDKSVTYTHDPTLGLTELNSIVTETTNNGNQIVLSLDPSASLEKGTQYYYNDNGTYYVFKSTEFFGFKQGDDTTDVITRKNSDPLRQDAVTITINKSTGRVTIGGQKSERKTYYIETSTLTAGKVYLIENTTDDVHRLLWYNMNADTNTYYDDWDAHGLKPADSCDYYQNGLIYDTSHTMFSIRGDTNQIRAIWSTDNGIELRQADESKIVDGDAYYVDSTGTSFLNEELYAEAKNGGCYLEGFDKNGSAKNKGTNANQQGRFSMYKGLGSIYSADKANNVYVHNICTGYHIEYKSSMSYDEKSRTSHDLGSIWTYDGSLLKNANPLPLAGNQNQYLTFANNKFELTDQASATTTTLFEKQYVYELEDISKNYTGFKDSEFNGTLYPSRISYTESDSKTEELVSSKTVEENQDDNTYHVTLEGYMKADHLTLPPTDIMLVLDMSGRMNDTLYTRNYLNLNTHTMFEEKAIADVSHDNLYNPANPNNENATGGIIGQSPRPYTYNTYVNDPNSPGTYVYLSQKYSNNSLFGSDGNTYIYTFTSENGATYTATVDISKVDSIRASQFQSLTFTVDNDHINQADCAQSLTIDSFFIRKDGNAKDAALCSTLYDYAHDSTRGLFYRDENGNYLPVEVSRIPEDSNNPTTYTFSVTVDAGKSTEKTYTVTYKNTDYGAGYSVFQGFKEYKPVTDSKGGIVYQTDENGEYILDSDGNLVPEFQVDLDNSLPSKTLYTLAKTADEKNVSRLVALKENVEDILTHVNQDSVTKHVTEHVGISTFSNTSAEKIPYPLTKVDMSDTRAVDAMIDDIYSYTATTTIGNQTTRKARIDVGIKGANTEFKTHSTDDARRFEIVYTAGVPTSKSNGKFELSIANAAIQQAYYSKNTYGATVYAVGMFDFANEERIHGDYFRYVSRNHDWVECGDSVGSVWGNSIGYSIFGDREVTPIDADATNRVLNFISSNYSSARSSALTYGRYNPGGYGWDFGGYGYRVVGNYSRTGDGYYFGVTNTTNVVTHANGQWTETIVTDTDPDKLERRFRTVFRSIESGMASPAAELDSDAILFDGITDYYNLVGNVTAYAAKMDGDPDDSITPIVSVDGKSITVTGFDYSTYNEESENPRKLVVEFDIERAPDFIGGNHVPTNTSNSAIMDSAGRLEEKFDIPAIDLDIIMNGTVAKDQSVYYSCEADLQALFDTEKVNGFNNAYVNITYSLYEADGETLVNSMTFPAGSVDGEWQTKDLAKMFPQMTEDKEYKVLCTIEPSEVGQVGTAYRPENGKATAHIYVFKPKFIATDERTQKDTPTNVVDNIGAITWVHEGDTVDEPQSEIPTVTYNIKQLPNGTATAPTDMSEVSLTDTTDFQIVDMAIAARDFTYSYLDQVPETVTEEDEDGNVINTYVVNVPTIIDDSVHRDSTNLYFKAENNHLKSAIYENEVDLNGDKATNDNGVYTILVSKPFALKVQKVFEGSYANPEAVTFTVTEGNDGTGATVATKTFNAEEFTRNAAVFESNVFTMTANEGKSFECDETYTLTETIVNSDHSNQYTVAIAGTDKANHEVSDTNTNDVAFTFSTDTLNDEITIVVTNTQIDPIITGLGNTDSKLNPFFIAAAIIALLGGSGTAYAVKRKKETEA